MAMANIQHSVEALDKPLTSEKTFNKEIATYFWVLETGKRKPKYPSVDVAVRHWGEGWWLAMTRPVRKVPEFPPLKEEVKIEKGKS